MSKKRNTIIGKQLINSAPRQITGLSLRNANGDIDPNSTGYQYVIDTLSYIRTKVIEQKFYEVMPADFMPVDVGEGAWSDEIVVNKSYLLGGDFFDGDIDTGKGNGRLAAVDAAVGPVRMPVITWAKAAQWSVVEIENAAMAGNWDVVEERMNSLMKNWQLGVQQVAFLGHPSRSLVTGLLNNGEVTINTTLIPKQISTMTETELGTFLAGILDAYNTNSNGTAMPDIFVMPTDDYLGMGTPYSGTYPNRSKLEYFLNMFKTMTQNENFQIKPLQYSVASRNASRGINKDRYVLYKNDPDVLTMSIPVDMDIKQAATTNNVWWEIPGIGQYSGVLVTRPREVLYLDETAP